MWEKISAIVAIILVVAAVVAGFYEIEHRVSDLETLTEDISDKDLEEFKDNIPTTAGHAVSIASLDKRLMKTDAQLRKVRVLEGRVTAIEDNATTIKALDKLVIAVETQLEKVSALEEKIAAAEGHSSTISALSARLSETEAKLIKVSDLEGRLTNGRMGCPPVQIATLGGALGNPFAAVTPSTIDMTVDGQLIAIFLDGIRWGGKRGNRVGALRLESNEYINAVEVWYTNALTRLGFTTNKGRKIVGGKREGTVVRLENIRLLKIGGRAGGLFDRIDLIYCIGKE